MTASSVPTDKVVCQSFSGIYWSSKDTPKTVEQVKEHNAAWKALCMAKAVKSSGVSFKDRWYEGIKIQLTAFR